MGNIDEETPFWEEIDRAENYLICCMFEEAAALASSIIKRLLEISRSNKDCEVSRKIESEWGDMVESAGMVLVQSLKQLRRTSEIVKELEELFGSLNAIPVQVFVTGVCFQMSESLLTTVQGSLEEFLNNWIYKDGQYYPISGAEYSVSGSSFMFSIGVEEYLEVVELYVITLLATTLKDTDRSISWVESAKLPMEKRQKLLRRIQSIDSSITGTSQPSISPHLPDDEYLSGDQKPYNERQKDVTSKYFSFGDNFTAKEEILKLSRERVPCFWWFRTIRLKIGNTELIVPTGKMMLASLLLLMYYFTRKKQAVLKRLLDDKAVYVKKSLRDLWQLAFSYQVNPLASVQTLPTTRGNH